MAKNMKKQSFERDSKAVLETILNPDAKARLRREMSLTQAAQSSAARTSPTEGKPASVSSPQKTGKAAEQSPSAKAQPKKAGPGKLTLASLNKRVTGEMEELRETLQSVEQSVQEVRSRSDRQEQDVQSLTRTAEGLQRELEQTARTLAEKPWEAMHGPVEQMLEKLEERIKRLESMPPPPPAAAPARAEAPKPEPAKAEPAPAAKTEPTKAEPASAAKPEPAKPVKPEPAPVAEPSAQEWLDRARALWSGRRYITPLAAVEFLDKALAREPDHAECLNERGLARIDAGLLNEALTDFSRAIALAPGMTAAYHNRGMLYAKMNAPEKACQDFHRAASLGDDRALRKARATGYCDGSLLKKFFHGIID